MRLYNASKVLFGSPAAVDPGDMTQTDCTCKTSGNMQRVNPHQLPG